jgi:hypothetical protein
MTVRRRWWVLLGVLLLVACTRHGTPTPAELCEHVVARRAAYDAADVSEYMMMMRSCMINAQETKDDLTDCHYRKVAYCIEQADTFEQLIHDCNAEHYLGLLTM